MLSGNPTYQEFGHIHFSMAPDKTPSLALLMSNGMGPRLRMALVESFKFSLIAQSEINVKMFLRLSPISLHGPRSDFSSLKQRR